MAAWPQFVPRVEWDVHLKAVEERFADLGQRISGHQEHHVQSTADLERLHGWCKEFAPRAEISHLGSRLDLQIACTDASIVEGLQEMRECSTLEVQRVRADVQAQIDTLKSGLVAANMEIARLDTALGKAVAFNFAASATKAEQESMRFAMEQSRELMYKQLRAAIDAVDVDKASHIQLEEARAALRSSDESLAADLATTSASLSQTTESLVYFDRLCRQTFATKESLSEVAGRVADLTQHTTQTVEDRLNLQSQLDSERERLKGNIGEVQECWRIVNETTDNVHHLKVGRTCLSERCDKNDQALESLSALESKHWQQCQEAMIAQQKSHEELQGTCELLRDDMQRHIEAMKQDGEKLRQHSTIRYLDQLDKACLLQQSVDKVQKGHQELHDSMRSIKLPKV